MNKPKCKKCKRSRDLITQISQWVSVPSDKTSVAIKRLIEDYNKEEFEFGRYSSVQDTD